MATTDMLFDIVDFNKQRILAFKPQHWDSAAKKFVVTGDENPLPTGNYIQNASGIWLPQTGENGAADTKITNDEANAVPTKVTGSDVEDFFVKQKVKHNLEELITAQTLEPGGRTSSVNLGVTDEKEVYLFISMTKQPWSLQYRNYFGLVSEKNGYPVYENETKTYNDYSPAISMPLGLRPDVQNITEPTTMDEAKNIALPLTDNEYFRITNNSVENATLTVRILRIWR